MPGKEAIINNLSKLPSILLGKIAEDNEIWEADDDNAHFKVTKDALSIPHGPTFYMLSVSGVRRAREKVIGDFIKTLGQPSVRSVVPGHPNIDMLSWDTEAAGKQIKR